MEFTVTAPGSNEIQIVRELPPELRKSNPDFLYTTMVSAEFGSMIFNNYPSEEYDIWFSKYSLKHDTEFKGRADIPVLELHIQFRNAFGINWDGIGKNDLLPKQFNLSYTPFVNTTAKFSRGRDYETFDIHFTKAYLEPLITGFPNLG